MSMSPSPTVLSIMENLPAQLIRVQGSRFERACSFSGIPAPMIRWEKDGSVLLVGEGRRIINSLGKSVLQINSLALSDSGVYTCSVTTVAWTLMSIVRLKVESKLMQLEIISYAWPAFFFPLYMWLSLSTVLPTTTVLCPTTALPTITVPSSTTAQLPTTFLPPTTAPPSTTVLSPYITTTSPPSSQPLPNTTSLPISTITIH